MKIRLSIIAVTLLLSGFSIGFGDVLKAQTATQSIFIDPLFDGNLDGSIIAHNTDANEITLNIGNALKQHLEQNSITATLSRNNKDELDTPETRIAIARSLGSDVYLALSVSRSFKSCIRLYYPPNNADDERQEGKNVMDAFIGLAAQNRIRYSNMLAVALYDNLKKTASPFCVEKKAGGSRFEFSYILEKAYSPVVIIDFEVSESSSPYILNSVITDKFIRAISAAIKDYLRGSKKAS